MKKLTEERDYLRVKLVVEGLNDKEMDRLVRLNSKIDEAPIDYEGPERMSSDIEKQILTKKTPYHGIPAIPEMDRDFIELISSKRFKDSVEKVRSAMGDTRIIQGQNPLMGLLVTVGNLMGQLIRIQMQNKEELESLAIELVKKELGIPKNAMQFKAVLVSEPMSTAEGMQIEPKIPNQDEIEEFMGDMENFNLERSKRRLINSLIQGAAFKGGHMYHLVKNEINNINPELMNLFAITQSLMEHAYWIFPNMEGIAGSGSGQMGQSEVDETTDPPTVFAKAVTFPLLVHELIKGVYEVFGTHGLPDDPKQQEMILSAEDTLPSEIWDSRLGPIFWEKFVSTYPMELFEDDMKHIQHYLFMRFSSLNAKEFMKISKQILSGDPKGNKFIQDMVNDIVDELKKEEFRQALPDEDDDDIDLSELGI